MTLEDKQEEDVLNQDESFVNPNSYLYELYPGVHEQSYSKLRILERLASLYQVGNIPNN